MHTRADPQMHDHEERVGQDLDPMTLRESAAWKFWALLLTIEWLLPITYTPCCHPSVVWCTPSVCYAVTASQLRLCTMYSERLSLQRLHTACQHGPVAVRQPIEQNLTILSDVVSALAIAITVCRQFQRYSVMPMTHYLTVLWQTVTMYSTCICLRDVISENGLTIGHW